MDELQEPDDEPRMRAAHLVENLDSLDVLGARKRDLVLGEFGRERIDRVRGASRLKWLPFELDVEMTGLVHEVAGRDGLRTWAQVAIRKTLSTPLLSGFVKAALRLVASPTSFVRMLPRAVGQVYRGLGTFAAETSGRGEPALRLDGAAPLTLSSDSWQLGFADAVAIGFSSWDEQASHRVELSDTSILWVLEVDRRS